MAVENHLRGARIDSFIVNHLPVVKAVFINQLIISSVSNFPQNMVILFSNHGKKFVIGISVKCLLIF